jgi:hypothetical protein
MTGSHEPKGANMKKAQSHIGDRTDYELRFQSLFRQGHALSFPCDVDGHVVLDSLSDHARDNYLYARDLVGREFAFPTVRAR